MRASILLSLTPLIHHTTASPKPGLAFNPATTPDCFAWYDNDQGLSCEFVRDEMFSIPAEEFSAWNPDVGLDCKPWRWQSYCAITKQKYDAIMATREPDAATPVSTSTASISTLRPTPTAWREIGCYRSTSSPPSSALEKKMSSDSDPALTIPKCQDTCYRASFQYAGVQEGDECWCSSSVDGERATNQAVCNRPCSGDRDTVCGGTGVVLVFEAMFEGDEWDGTATGGGGAAPTGQVGEEALPTHPTHPSLETKPSFHTKSSLAAYWTSALQNA
ncbi:WSC-domain-containing protein [Sporormia fimetaria CBS 119925]|uniref:WSC-domain-containing protein n=1 Tax=Sporormia fimetaria CBS 119925 TaxID=1340428 RepID=A0A6A6VAU9_9PLEO|nr:WSC-domain-containing protein [Sporormia fimetaria CBS 119925]